LGVLHKAQDLSARAAEAKLSLAVSPVFGPAKVEAASNGRAETFDPARAVQSRHTLAVSPIFGPAKVEVASNGRAETFGPVRAVQGRHTLEASLVDRAREGVAKNGLETSAQDKAAE
jgi:hypothetical protein